MPEIGGVRIAAIGPATASRVRDFRLKVELQPAEYVAVAIVAALQKEGRSRIRESCSCAPQARDVTAELTRLGAIVDEATRIGPCRRLRRHQRRAVRFKSEGADLITFTSSSTVENFVALKLPWPDNLKPPDRSDHLRDDARIRRRSTVSEAIRHPRSDRGLANYAELWLGCLSA